MTGMRLPRPGWAELVGRILELTASEEFDDAHAARVAAGIARTRAFYAPAEEVAAAIDEALPRQTRLTGLAPGAVERDEAEFRDFLRRVRAELDHHPWSSWRYEQLGLDAWGSDGVVPVARLALSPRQLTATLSVVFQLLREDDARLEIAVLGLLDGPVVALARDRDAASLETVLLYRGGESTDVVLAAFLSATGIDAEHVTWQPSRAPEPLPVPPAPPVAGRQEGEIR